MKEQQTYPIESLREQYEKENPEKQLVTVCHHVAAFTDDYIEWLESKLRDVMPCPPKKLICSACNTVILQWEEGDEHPCLGKGTLRDVTKGGDK